MCQIDITKDQANDTMIQGVAHNLHTSEGDLRMLAEVLGARGKADDAYVVTEVAETVHALVHACLKLYGLACLDHSEHAHDAVGVAAI